MNWIKEKEKEKAKAKVKTNTKARDLAHPGDLRPGALHQDDLDKPGPGIPIGGKMGAFAFYSFALLASYAVGFIHSSADHLVCIYTIFFLGAILYLSMF